MLPRRITVKFLVQFNVGCIIVFIIARMLAGQESFAVQARDGTMELQESMTFTDALYASVMTQSTVGLSDVIPVTTSAKVITSLQGAAALGTVLMLVLFASK